MEIRFRDSTADRIKSDLVVIPVRDKQLDDPALRALDRHLKGQLRARMSKGNFTGAEGSVLLHPTAGMLPAAYLLLIGIGAGEITGDTWRKTGAKARKEAGAIGAGEFAMLLAAEKNLEQRRRRHRRRRRTGRLSIQQISLERQARRGTEVVDLVPLRSKEDQRVAEIGRYRANHRARSFPGARFG